MPFIDPPTMIAQLKTQAKLCAALTGIADNRFHYPKAEPLASLSFPLFVLFQDDFRPVPFCEGASPLPNGRLGIIVMSTDDVGIVEQLGQNLLYQLIQQQVGIPFLTGECGLSSDPSPGKIAGGLPVRTITLHLPYGLQP